MYSIKQQNYATRTDDLVGGSADRYEVCEVARMMSLVGSLTKVYDKDGILVAMYTRGLLATVVAR